MHLQMKKRVRVVLEMTALENNGLSVYLSSSTSSTQVGD